MPSAASIAAQAVPSLLAAFPGWKLPTLLNLKFSVGAVGAPTIVSVPDASGDAGTTPGFAITRVSAAVYDITFPACRQVAWGTLTCCAKSTTAGTPAATDARYPLLDRSVTFTDSAVAGSPLGKARVVFATGAAITTELGNGSEMNLSFWADLG